MEACNNFCLYKKIDGWLEVFVCTHPKYKTGKIIKYIKGNFPVWCPLKGELNESR